MFWFQPSAERLTSLRVHGGRRPSSCTPRRGCFHTGTISMFCGHTYQMMWIWSHSVKTALLSTVTFFLTFATWLRMSVFHIAGMFKPLKVNAIVRLDLRRTWVSCQTQICSTALMLILHFSLKKGNSRLLKFINRKCPSIELFF